MRLVYAVPVAVAPVTSIQASRLRAGFMDIIESAADTLNQKGHGRLRQTVRALRYRKL